MSSSVWFSDWATVTRTLAVGTAGYAALVLLLRITGQRTLAKMNAFDFVVTVALGSILGSLLVSTSVSFVQGVLALALLVGLQFLITWLSVRIAPLRRVVTGEAVLLALRGEPLTNAMRRSRITQAELEAIVRSEGIARMADVEAVVLETDGSCSVIRRPSEPRQVVADLLPEQKE